MNEQEMPGHGEEAGGRQPELTAIARRREDLTPGEQRRIVLVTLARVLITILSIVVVYALIPFDASETWTVVVTAIVGLVVIVTVSIFQIRAIAIARMPSIQAVQTLALVVPLVVFWFAATYYGLSASSPGSFNEDLDHVGAVYFSMTTLTTIGYGDIAPDTDTARLVVMMNMVVNVLVIGLAVRLSIMAVRRNLEATPEQRAAFEEMLRQREARRRRLRRRGRLRSDVDQHLADVGVGLDVAVGVGDPVEREPRVDDRDEGA